MVVVVGPFWMVEVARIFAVQRTEVGRREVVVEVAPCGRAEVEVGVLGMVLCDQAGGMSFYP